MAATRRWVAPLHRALKALLQVLFNLGSVGHALQFLELASASWTFLPVDAADLGEQFGPCQTFERACGVHLSLGGKHNVYKKVPFKRKDKRAHVDVFVKTHEVRLDGQVIFRDGAWCP